MFCRMKRNFDNRNLKESGRCARNTYKKREVVFWGSFGYE